MRGILSVNEVRDDHIVDAVRMNWEAGLRVHHPEAAVRVATETVEEERPMSKLEQEQVESRSIMVVDATARDLRTLNLYVQENNLEDDLMMQFFRLKGDKFVMILNSLLSVQSWKQDIKPKLIEMFGNERCRFETNELEEQFVKLVGGEAE